MFITRIHVLVQGSSYQTIPMSVHIEHSIIYRGLYIVLAKSALYITHPIKSMGLLSDIYDFGSRMRCFPRHRLQRKLLVSDLGMHHGTCVTHVPWCMSGSLTRGGGENIPSISGTCATGNYMYLVRGPLVRQVKQPCATCQQKAISLYLQGSCLSTLAALMSCLNITIELPCSHKGTEYTICLYSCSDLLLL